MISTIRISSLFLSTTIFLFTVMACESRPATTDRPEQSRETEVSLSSPDTAGEERSTTQEVPNPNVSVPPDLVSEPVLEPLTVALADKMNVFYVGVNNPISIQSNGEQEELSVSISGGDGTVMKNSTTRYTVRVGAPGKVTISITQGDRLFKQDFRAKLIPDPQARLSAKSGGAMGAGEFKAQGGFGAFLDDFDFDVTCQVVGFELTCIMRRADAVMVQNTGARFNDASRRLINRAKPGDYYLFNNVRAKCPGDLASRKINSMAFKIR